MISNEIYNFLNSGNDPGEFPETFSRRILLQFFSDFRYKLRQKKPLEIFSRGKTINALNLKRLLEEEIERFNSDSP